MKRDRRVKDMAAAAQRFRRRVLAMLDARDSALWALYEKTPEVEAHRRATNSIRQRIAEMR